MRAKARMAISQCLSVFGLHGKVLVVWGLRSTHHTLHFKYWYIHCPHSASHPTHFRITTCLQTRLHSTNQTPPSCPHLASSARKVWNLAHTFLLCSILEPSPLPEQPWGLVPFPKHQSPASQVFSVNAGDAPSI